MINEEGAPNAERRRDEPTQEELEMLAFIEQLHPKPVATPEKRQEAEPHIKELRTTMEIFEREYPLETLRSITTAEDAYASILRKAAVFAGLPPIVAKLDFLRRETNISGEALAALQVQYETINLAVGMINGDRLDHEVHLRPLDK